MKRWIGIAVVVIGGRLFGCAPAPDYVMQGGWEYERHLASIDGHDYRFVVTHGRVVGEVALMTKDDRGRVMAVRWVGLDKLRASGDTLRFVAPLGRAGHYQPVAWRLKVVDGFDVTGAGWGELTMTDVPGARTIRIPLERRPWTFAESAAIPSEHRAVISSAALDRREPATEATAGP